MYYFIIQQMTFISLSRFATQIINSYLCSMMSANHYKVEWFQPIVKSLYLIVSLLQNLFYLKEKSIKMSTKISQDETLQNKKCMNGSVSDCHKMYRFFFLFLYLKKQFKTDRMKSPSINKLSNILVLQTNTFYVV